VNSIDIDFETFIQSAWNDHGDRPDEVASRLASSLAIIASRDDVAPYVRLVIHVYGEHLGKWDEGVSLVASIRALPVCDDSVTPVLDRAAATLHYAAGKPRALDTLGREDRIAALATASSALAGRNRFHDALSAYALALQLADGDLPANSPAIRALAVGGNNLAAALEEKTDRDTDEARGMVSAATAALKYWKLAGTWLEEERAEYRLSRSACLAGEHRDAVAAATRCVDICSRNDAPALERFFGYTALALAHRAAGDDDAFAVAKDHALRHYDLVAPDERQWCASELSLL
jgi:hypothetical protein